MLGLTFHDVRRSAPAPPDLGEALGRAQEEARASGAFLKPPFAFHPLSEEAARALAPTEAPAWVLVTVQPSADDGHRAHTRERCLTAAQRFMLQLACDDVESVWVEPAPEAEAVREAGLNLGGAQPVGLIRCG